MTGVPFKLMKKDLPLGSVVYADSAYIDYEYHNELLENAQVRLITEQKSNTRHPMALEDYVNLKYIRKYIEGAFGVISRLLPRKIHATTPLGFEIKVIGFVIAAAINFIIN